MLFVTSVLFGWHFRTHFQRQLFGLQDGFLEFIGFFRIIFEIIWFSKGIVNLVLPTTDPSYSELTKECVIQTYKTISLKTAFYEGVIRSSKVQTQLRDYIFFFTICTRPCHNVFFGRCLGYLSLMSCSIMMVMSENCLWTSL